MGRSGSPDRWSTTPLTAARTSPSSLLSGSWESPSNPVLDTEMLPGGHTRVQMGSDGKYVIVDARTNEPVRNANCHSSLSGTKSGARRQIRELR